ncbi:MAG: adenylate/guanylate cyclase domain-containing protein, partial [Thermodesulfobacteriota bacterium]
TVTALFADLKGSTALIEGLDPEEARAIIDPALKLMMDAVHRYEGYVAQALGDGIFALFGAPIAHEDHAHRAIYAALRMQEEMRRYAEQRRRAGGAPLFLRVGINTGEAVVRSIRKDDLHTDYVPVGHSTNIAARMEGLATPGTIVVSEQTYKLTEGYFGFKALGEAQIKGVSGPINVYEVVGVSPFRTKLQVAARRGLARFIGRQSEMAHLRRALEQARAGQGQIVGVVGEPGVGKSRLFYEFIRLYGRAPLLVLETFSVSHGKAAPYLPVIELLKTYFEITLEDDERRRREKVGGKVLMLDRSLEDTLPYLFALLGIDDPATSLQQMDPEMRRKRACEALKRLFLRESLNQPLLLIFEDLHWIDSETQGFLDMLSEGMASAKILLLVNYRPEYRHEWGQKTYYTQLRLAPLGRAEAEELLDTLLGTERRLRALKALILEKTDGTPFFMEEVVQELREQGALAGEAVGGSPLPSDLHIPTTVQGVLAARIDRLAPEEKALLQHLAVLGREFPLRLVRQVVARPEDELYRLLSSLQRKEFLYEQPAFPEVGYLFKHALTQEVAYNSVLHERRKVLHEHTARALEALYAGSLEEHYSDLAHHYSRSSNTEKAIECLHLAGKQAARRSANDEAINHLTRALELLGALPDTRERAQRELDLQLSLGAPLKNRKSWAAQEVGQAYGRALALCQQLGARRQLFPVLQGLWEYYQSRADHQKARELADQMLQDAREQGDAALLLVAHDVQADTLTWLGEFTLAREHAEAGMRLYDPPRHHALTFTYGGYDPGVVCRCYASLTLWPLGYPDRAVESIKATLALASQLAHPFSLSWALCFAAMLAHFMGNERAALEWLDALRRVSDEHGFAFWSPWVPILGGRIRTGQGAGEGELTGMEEGLRAWQATGTELLRPWFLTLLAESYGDIGQSERGLSAVREALSRGMQTGERWFAAEGYRVKGELVLQPKVGNPKAKSEDAEACFLKAIEIARHQQAKSLELRASTSLARLWQRQGKQEAARHLLAEIYGWFTEGFDTTDLQEAKALLEELT